MAQLSFYQYIPSPNQRGAPYLPAIFNVFVAMQYCVCMCIVDFEHNLPYVGDLEREYIGSYKERKLNIKSFDKLFPGYQLSPVVIRKLAWFHILYSFVHFHPRRLQTCDPYQR